MAAYEQTGQEVASGITLAVLNADAADGDVLHELSQLPNHLARRSADMLAQNARFSAFGQIACLEDANVDARKGKPVVVARVLKCKCRILLLEIKCGIPDAFRPSEARSDRSAAR